MIEALKRIIESVEGAAESGQRLSASLFAVAEAARKLAP
jgi:hypothetical protein